MRKDPVTMLVNPLPATFKINYDGKEQEIKTLFLINSKSSAAQAVGKDKLAMQIIQMQVCISASNVLQAKQETHLCCSTETLIRQD